MNLLATFFLSFFLGIDQVYSIVDGVVFFSYKHTRL